MHTTSKLRPVAGALLFGVLAAVPVDVAAQVAEGPTDPAPPVLRITLDEALAAFSETSRLRIARLGAEQADAAARQSAAYPNPALTATHESLDASGADISETYLNLSQRLEWPGTRSARTAAAAARAAAARARVASDSSGFAYDVKRTFVAAARAEADATTLEEVTDVFREAAAAAQSRFEEGDISLYDLRRVEIERTRYEAALADALLETARTRRELARLVMPEAEELRVAPAGMPEGALPGEIPADVVAAAIGTRAETEAAEAEARSARAELRGARAGRVPDLTATGGFKTQSDGFEGVFLGVSLPVPLWDRSDARIDGADAGVGVADETVLLVRREVEADVRNALEAYRSQLARYEFVATQAGGPRPTPDILEIARAAYEEGSMELLDLLDAAEAYLDAELARMRIRAELWISYYDLERAAGGLDDPAEGEDDEE